MHLWLRMLRVLIAALFRPRLDFHQESRLAFRVWPHDLDINIHMNNARYVALMDLGRLDLILRCGVWRPMLKCRWQAVIGGSLIRYRRPLGPFQSFSLTSRLLSWDDKWIYIEHRIEAGAAMACHAIVRAAFVEAGKVVSPHRVAEAAGFAGIQPVLPDWVGAWRDADRAFEQQQPPLTAAGEEMTCVR